MGRDGSLLAEGGVSVAMLSSLGGTGAKGTYRPASEPPTDDAPLGDDWNRLAVVVAAAIDGRPIAPPIFIIVIALRLDKIEFI